MPIKYNVKSPKSNDKLKSKKLANEDSNAKKEPQNKKYFNLLVIIIIVIVSGLVISLSVIFTMNKKTKAEGKFEGSNFIINTKVNKLSQFLMKSSQSHYSLSNSSNSTLYIFHNAKFDIYTLNESIPEKEEDLYSKIYNSAIIINSQCFEFEENKKDCQLNKYLDLTIKNQNNLRRVNENIEELKQAILPICIIEHSDTNIIFSVTCPDKLSENLKNTLISAFQSIKPNLSKEYFKNYNLAELTINKTSNEILINLFDKRCDYFNKTENQSCETIRNITTDKSRNLLQSFKKSKFYKAKDNKNKYYNNINNTFEEINKENKYDEDNFKYNINIILELIKPLMKKEEFITLEMLSNSTNKELDYSNSRKLQDENIFGYIEEKFFSQSLFGINLELYLKNDFGLEKGEKAKAISKLIRGEKIDEIRDEALTNLYEVMNKFIILSKAGNKMANELYQKINNSFSNLKNEINDNISDLNNLLIFKDLSSIFDSTFAINNLKELPYSIILISNYLYTNITKLNMSIEDSIINIKNELKNNIQSFLNVSHSLIDNIINNLTDFNDILSSNKSMISEISTYYLQYKDSEYKNIAKIAKSILDNFIINEKNKIDFFLNKLFKDFSNSFLKSIQKIHTLLDNIINRLKDKSLNIKSGTNKDIKYVINNLSNTKIIINQIISNIPYILKNRIGIKNNGYFMSNEEINNNKKKYEVISDKAINISYTLDNNILIDTIFDNIMEDFKKQFIILLNYIDKSKKEKFPLKNNMFLNSSFILDLFDKMEGDFTEEKNNILNYIKDENKIYLESIENETRSFNEKNRGLLDNLINDIDIELSELNLFNLDSKYNEMLNITFNSINNVIENNKNIAVEYMTNVKNAGSSYCTQLYKNKANIFFNSFKEIKNYVQLNLKNNLIKEYENSINSLKNNLEIVKFNTFNKNYLTKFTFIGNHLRIIDILFSRIEKYLSNKIFNNKYLTIIDNYINSNYNKINQIESSLNSLYSSVSNLEYSSSTSYDYYLLRITSNRYCAKKVLGACVDHKRETIYNYDGYTVSGTNNYLSLKSINFDEYKKDFFLLFNNIYVKITNDYLQYNNTLNLYQNNLNLIKKEILNRNNNYLNKISEKINYFINEKLSKYLTILAYNYFREEIENKLTIELDNISFQWKNIFNKLITNINLNIDKFKYSIQEFGILTEQYYKIIYQNISNDYSNSIIEQRMNDFNYTIKNYFNMIFAKVNKTFSNILNNMPINEEIFNDILNIRNKEIQKKYNDLMNEINITKNKYLQIDTQLNIIDLNDINSFYINSNIEKNIDFNKNQLFLTYEELLKNLEKVNKESTQQSILSRIYLENLQYAKQIKDIYEPVNKEEFIDLQSNVFKELISENLEIDQDELIKEIKKSLINFNALIIKNFEKEKEKYENILQNKIFKEFYKIEDLENKIDSLYENGLNNIDINSKTIIYGYLNEILNLIKSQISNEISRLTNELTSYNNNYENIQKTLNNLKISIYNSFYSAIFSINNEFYSQILNKFYNNYIEKYLDEYKNNVQKENLKEYKFLNISFNLKSILGVNIELLVNEYKNLTIKHINYLSQKYNQQIDQLFSFSDFKNRINNEIDLIYKSQLLPILEEKAIYNSSDNKNINYDLSDLILTNINYFIEDKINHTLKIIGKLKGNKYNIEENWKRPDFSLIKNEELLIIQNSFNNFTRNYSEIENNEFNKTTLKSISKSFKIKVQNFIPSFGKDFFERIIKYNEIQKIKTLFNNLKYSLAQTINYYIKLFSLHSSNAIPEDLKDKILSLGNINSLVNSLKNEEIIKLNKKINKIFEETKDYIVDKFIYYIKVDPYIKLSLDNYIKSLVDNIIDDNREILENEYNDIINISIKNSFIEQYKRSLNEESKYLIDFIEEQKKIIKEKLDSINIIKTDAILSEIKNKFNNLERAIDIYNFHFNSFEISQNISILLDNYCKEVILPYYEEIQLILDYSTKDIVIQNLDTNVNNLKQNFIINNFISKSNNNSINIKNSYFNNMVDYLKYSYGSIDSLYLSNLNKEIINYKNLRNLDDLKGDKENKNIADIKLDEILKLIKNESLSFLEYFKNLKLFKDFNEKINKYIEEIHEQYLYSKNNIKIMNYEEKINNTLNENLDILSDLIINYYKKANSSYCEAREYIEFYISQINDLIQDCIANTYEQINKKYIEIQNDFNSINHKTKEEKPIEIEKHEEKVDGMNYIIKTKIDKYIIDNEMILDIILEEDNDIIIPKIKGKILNRNHPKKMVIDFYSNYGQNCEIKGRKMTIYFNNISLISDFIFDTSLNNITINNKIDFDEYNIKNEKYTIKEENFLKVLGGIKFIIPNLCISSIDGENEIQIIDAIKKNIFEIIKY